MDIKTEHKKLIIDEIKYVLKSMKETEEPAQIIYFFSGIYAMMQRVFNIEYDSELVFAHMILKITHDTFSQKTLNQDPVIQLKNEHFENLYQLSEKLCEKIENDENLHDVLKGFAILTYSMGGNGNYLAHKGCLNFDFFTSSTR